MSELSDIQENVKEFLRNVDIDFSLPLVETKFQIFEEIKIIYELEGELNEEFYDLKYDPYEVNNLILDSKYSVLIDEFRNALVIFQQEINDQGFIPENKIVESFWPNLIQPKTENVEFKMRDDGLYELTSITNGASIGYQIEDQIGTNSWSLYHKPILLGDKQKIVARAIRLGYKASEITSN